LCIVRCALRLALTKEPRGGQDSGASYRESNPIYHCLRHNRVPIFVKGGIAVGLPSPLSTSRSFQSPISVSQSLSSWEILLSLFRQQRISALIHCLLSLPSVNSQLVNTSTFTPPITPYPPSQNANQPLSARRGSHQNNLIPKIPSPFQSRRDRKSWPVESNVCNSWARRRRRSHDFVLWGNVLYEVAYD
jgi:hypothetical protein